VASDGVHRPVHRDTHYGATGAFWSSLGYENTFETDHGSGFNGSTRRRSVCLHRRAAGEPLETHPIIGVSDSLSFASARADRLAGRSPRGTGASSKRSCAIRRSTGQPAGTAPGRDAAPDADAHPGEVRLARVLHELRDIRRSDAIVSCRSSWRPSGGSRPLVMHPSRLTAATTTTRSRRWRDVAKLVKDAR